MGQKMKADIKKMFRAQGNLIRDNFSLLTAASAEMQVASPNIGETREIAVELRPEDIYNHVITQKR